MDSTAAMLHNCGVLSSLIEILVDMPIRNFMQFRNILRSSLEVLEWLMTVDAVMTY